MKKSDGKKIVEKIDKEKMDEMRIILGTTFELIKEVLHEYIKLKEEYYDLVAIWIIGTYFTDNFETYPYLFINAQKGSGKTRLLKLIEILSHKGILLASMREAVLFRLADKGYTLLIDELEGLERKENAPLKELLNACYKRGTKVFRMKKVGDTWGFEDFEPFTPIAIANISGTDDVLGDRCITIRLDKSTKSHYSLLTENFKINPKIIQIIKNFGGFKQNECSKCSLFGGIKEGGWNDYVKGLYNVTSTTTTLTTLTTLTTPSTPKNVKKSSVVSVVSGNSGNSENDSSVVTGVVSDKISVVSPLEMEVYNEIINSKINGRQLELIFPLLQISLMLNRELFDKILATSKKISKEKIEEDVMESNDVSVIDFVSKKNVEIDYNRYRFVHKLADEFRYFLGIRDRFEEQEINSKWIGKALKRLGLVVDKRRLSEGVEVKLNIPKATKLLENLR